MTAHASLSVFVGERGSKLATGIGRSALFVALLATALAIFFFGAPYFDLFPTNRNLGYQGALSALFLASTLWSKRDERLANYGRMAFALFMASFAICVTQLIGNWTPTVISRLNVSTGTSQWTALAKVYEVLLIVVPILVLTKLSGADLASIYVRRGDLKWGLSIGGLVLLNYAASAFLFFATRFGGVESLVAALGWGLVFSLANGFMEELWVRGIILRPLGLLIGPGGAVLLTSIVFSLMHAGAVYVTPIAIPFYVATTFTMGLACGYLIIKTGSIWGATLIHAASDLFLFIAMLASA